MRAAEALSRLLRLGVPVVRTSEAAAVLEQSRETASKMLGRLADAGLLVRIRHGLWWLGRGPVDPLALPEYLTAPYPAYISLYTALFHHGLLSQIPEAIFAVSLGRTQRVVTSAGAFSIHHVAPEFFGGFEVLSSGIKLASPEKALADLAYLSATKARLFAAPPELELPRRFRPRAAEQWIERLPSARTRSLVRARYRQLLARVEVRLERR